MSRQGIFIGGHVRPDALTPVSAAGTKTSPVGTFAAIHPA